MLNTINIELNRQNPEILMDAVKLSFDSSYTTPKSFEDATKLWNNTEHLAIVNGNDYVSIDKRNLPQVNDTVPLYLGNYKESQYTLKLESTLESDIPAILYDEYLDQIIVLDMGNNFYDFTIDNAIPESIDNERFKLVFNPETLSLNENLVEDDIKVYPNPVENIVNLSIPEILLEQKAKLQVFDRSGRLLLQKDIDNLDRQESIDLSRFSSGLYILKIQANGTEQSFKLTKI
jgi:hypothetical protein